MVPTRFSLLKNKYKKKNKEINNNTRFAYFVSVAANNNNNMSTEIEVVQEIWQKYQKHSFLPQKWSILPEN